MIKELALLSPIFITLFWSLVFIIQIGSKDKSKFLLGAFMVHAFLLYTSHAIFFNNLPHLYSFIESIYILSMLSLYPVFYNYILLLTTGEYCPKKYYHFIPALVFSFVALMMTLFLSPEQRIFYVEETLLNRNLKGLNISTAVGLKGIVFLLSRAFFIVQVAAYAFLAIKVANEHNQRILDYYSNTEGKTLNWVRLLSIGFLIISSASITFAFIGRSSFNKNEAWLLIPSAIFSFVFFTIGFKGNQQQQFNSELKFEDPKLDFNETKTGQTELLKSRLVQLFIKDKIYKYPDLRIATISETLKTNRTYISKLINEEFNMNFNEFVNNYRIEEAKELLLDTSHDLYSMEYIAEKSGFGSINSFTRVFKTITGLTPGKFREQSLTGKES